MFCWHTSRLIFGKFYSVDTPLDVYWTTFSFTEGYLNSCCLPSSGHKCTPLLRLVSISAQFIQVNMYVHTHKSDISWTLESLTVWNCNNVKLGQNICRTLGLKLSTPGTPIAAPSLTSNVTRYRTETNAETGSKAKYRVVRSHETSVQWAPTKIRLSPKCIT